MPLPGTVAYSKLVQLPNGKVTLGLFNKKHHLLEYRACTYDKVKKKFHCPKQATHPKERAALVKKLGIDKLNRELYLKELKRIRK